MTTFVLVPGAWHPGRAWDRVTPFLRDAGARVVTPDLPPDPEAGLATHAADVCAVLDTLADDDGPVVLVGHSYAGLVVRQAADQRAHRVRHIVLVEGWAGGDGASLIGLAPDWFGDAVRAAAQATGDGWLVPAPPPAVFGIDDPADAAWLAGLLHPHPLRAFDEATRLSGAVEHIPGTGIACRPESFPFAAMAAALGYRPVTLEGPHDVMVTAPAALAAELLAAAGD